MRLPPFFVVFALGCSAPDQDHVAVRWHDEAQFSLQVQPILAGRCGNPSCHGRPERPLSIFSPRRYRLDPGRTHLDEALTQAELEHNYRLSCVLSTEGEQPADTWLLRKPLGSSAAVYHAGGDVFESSADLEYRTLLAWVETGWP